MGPTDIERAAGGGSGRPRWPRAGARPAARRAALLRDQRGTVVVLFALLLLPLLGVIGLAVDSARGYMARNRLQAAVDAAALAGGRILHEKTASGVRGDVEMFFAANFPERYMDAGNERLEVALDRDEGTVRVDAEVTLPTTFMGALGVEAVTVRASSTVKSGTSGLELVMVFDVSGSMDRRGKTEAMKRSAKDLLAILYGERDRVPDLYVGYSTYKLTVNIGAHRTGWLTNYDPDDFEPTVWKGCVDARDAPHDQDDSPPSVKKWAPYLWPPGAKGNWWPRVRGNPERRGPNVGCNPNGILPLTDDRDVVEAGIDALDTSLIEGDGTNPTTGMAWGWRLISPRWRGLWGGDTPAERPLDYDDPDSDKAVILLTDGQTNFAPDSRTPYGFLEEGRLGTTGKRQADDELNRRLVNICAGMKAEGVTVYTIMFDIDDPDLEAVYRACASSPDNYFKSATNEDLRRAFRAIGGKLSSLRVAR